CCFAAHEIADELLLARRSHPWHGIRVIRKLTVHYFERNFLWFYPEPANLNLGINSPEKFDVSISQPARAISRFVDSPRLIQVRLNKNLPREIRPIDVPKSNA